MMNTLENVFGKLIVYTTYEIVRDKYLTHLAKQY